MPSTRGRQVVLPLTNKSGGSVAAGDVVVIDTANNESFTTTTTGRAEVSIGVAQETIANNATGRVLVAGYAALVNVPSSVTRGHYLETHTVAKQATGNSTRRSGSAGQFLTTSAAPTAWLWGQTDQTASGGSFGDWTPALTASTTNPTLGTGSSVRGRYYQVGKHVTAKGVIAFGTSGTNAGSGTYYISLPVAAEWTATPKIFSRGTGHLFDSSSGAERVVRIIANDGSTCKLLIADGSTYTTHAAPWAWAVNDQIDFELDYEAA